MASLNQMHHTQANLTVAVILYILVRSSQQQNQAVSCLYTQKVKLWTPSAPFKTNTPLGYNVPVLWKSVQPAIMSSGMALAGFQLQDNNITLSFDASLKDVTASGAVVNYNPHSNSKIQYAEFSVILVLSGCENKVELITAYHQMAFLNRSRGSGTIESEIFSSSIFTFTNIFDFQAFTELTCFKIGFSLIITELQVYKADPLVFPNLIKINFQTNHPFDIIESATFLIIIFNRNSFVPSLSYQLAIKQLEPFNIGNSSVSAQNFSVDTDTFGDNYEEKCLIGLGSLRIKKLQPIFLYYEGFPAVIIKNINIFFFKYRAICFSQCPITYYISYANSTTQCLRCMEGIPNCLNCNNITFCTQCMPMYFLLQPDLCKTCHQAFYQCHKCNQTHCLLCFLGEKVQGGCSMLPGCRKVKQLMTFTEYHSSPCIACYEPEYSFSNGQCICVGYIVTGVCTIVKGCIEAIRINHVPICLGCHIQLNFMLVNQTCVCIDGFSIVGEACLDSCGDGRVFQSDCDDGNIADGDGCSSNCVVERGFHCFNGSHTSKSRCMYMKTDVQLIVESMDKLDFVNEGKFIFKVTPEMGILSHMNFASLIHFDCNASFQITSVSYSSGFIEMSIPYQTDLEQKMAKLTISLDPALFAHQSSIILVFQIYSKGAQLIIQSNSKYNQQAAIVLKVSSIIVLCLMAVAPWFGKMIAIELITTYQLIFLSHFLSKHYTQSLMIFRELTISLLNIDYYINKKSNVDLHSYNRLTYGITNNKTSIYLLLGIVLVGFCLFCLSLFLVKMKSSKAQDHVQEDGRIKKKPNFVECYSLDKSVEKEQSKQQKPKKKKGWRTINFKSISAKIYIKILFNFSIGFFYLSILTALSANLRISTNILSINNINEIPSLFMLLIYLFSGLIFFKEWKIILQSNLKEISDGRSNRRSINKYTALFLTYQFSAIFLLTLSFYGIISYGREAVLACTLSFLIWFALHPPYNKFYNNAGIYLNLSTITVFLVWIIVRDRVAVIRSGGIELIIIIVVTSLMVFCLALSGVRILIVAYRRLNCTDKEEAKAQELEQEIMEEDENDLPLQKILKRKMNKTNKMSLYTMNYKQKMEALLIENQRRDIQNNYAIYNKQDAARKEAILEKVSGKGVITKKEAINREGEAQIAAIKSKLRQMYRMGNFQKEVEKIRI